MAFKLEKKLLSRISVWAERYVKEQKFAGLSIMVKQAGQEVFFNAVGQLDIESDKPFARDTVARIYSMTKPITALALMTLVEKGYLSLNTPVSAFLPEFTNCHALIPKAKSMEQTFACQPPTLHQLLTHTSGLSYSFNKSLVSDAMKKRNIDFSPDSGTLADQCKSVATLPLAFQPGAKWEYSVGIDIIGRVIEVVTGQNLGEFLMQQVFEPLEIKETSFSVKPNQQRRFASLYTPFTSDPMYLGQHADDNSSLHAIDNTLGSPFLEPTLHSGGGGLVGTIDDYMKFAECLRRNGQGPNEKIIYKSTAKVMLANHLQGDIASLGTTSFSEQPMDGVGFSLAGAVIIDPALSTVPGSIGDFSWGGIASTFFWVDPINHLSVVMFTQLAPSSSYPIRAELKALVHGALS